MNPQGSKYATASGPDRPASVTITSYILPLRDSQTLHHDSLNGSTATSADYQGLTASTSLSLEVSDCALLNNDYLPSHLEHETGQPIKYYRHLY